jgi:hypothetical protein
MPQSRMKQRREAERDAHLASNLGDNVRRQGEDDAEFLQQVGRPAGR